MKGDGSDRLGMSRQRPNGVGGVEIPDSDSVIFAARGQEFFRWVERHGVHLPGMSRQSAPFAARLRVEDLDVASPISGQVLAVGTEGCAHESPIPFDPREQFSRGRVPYVK